MSVVRKLSDAPITSLKDKVSPEEWQTRVDLAAFYRLVAWHGWDDMIYTHISARVPGPETHFVMNPFGLLFEEITASSLIKVDMQGELVMDSPYLANPAGFTIHSAVHGAREDAHCVAHLHTDDGVAVAAQKEGLLPLSQHAMIVRRRTATHAYEGIALNLDERERLVKDLGDNHLMLLKNHGTLALGKDCATAYQGIYYLERACSMQVRAQAGGGELVIPSEEVQALTHKQGAAIFDGSAGALAWPALLRKLDKLDASYRT